MLYNINFPLFLIWSCVSTIHSLLKHFLVVSQSINETFILFVDFFFLFQIANDENGSYFNYSKNVCKKTVGHLKRITSLIDKMIEGCSIRDWNVKMMKLNLSNEECRKYFTLTKYRMQSYMCYMLTSPETKYTLYFSLDKFDHNRLLFQVSISSRFSKSHQLHPLLHLNDFLLYQRYFSKTISLLTRQSISSNTFSTLFYDEITNWKCEWGSFHDKICY